MTLKYRITISKNSREQLHGVVKIQNNGNIKSDIEIQNNSNKNSREQLHGEVQVQNIGNLIYRGDWEEPENLPPYYFDWSVIHMCSCITVTESLGMNIMKKITNFLNCCSMKNFKHNENNYKLY